jgi:hypothetical protein
LRPFVVFPSGVIGAVLVALAVCACSGSSTLAVPQRSSSTTASSTVITSATASTFVTATSANGTVVTVELPAASARVAVTESLTSTAPSGYATSRALRGGVFAERSALAGTPDAILYIVLTSDAPVTFAGAPSVTVVLPSITTGDAYYLAGLSSAGATTFTDGPGAIAGTTVTFGSLPTGLSITPNDPLVIEFYAIPPMSSASPSPVPSTTPVPVVATPTSLTFASTNSAPQDFTVTQSGVAGSFTITTAPSGIVTVAAAAVAGAYTVTPVGVGTATITITGSGGASTTVTATVQTLPITVSSTHRGR